MGIYTDHLSHSQIMALRAEFDRMLDKARLEGTYSLPERTRLPALGQWREHECSRCGHYEYRGNGRLQGHSCPHVAWDWQKAAVLDAFWAYDILADGQKDCRLHPTPGKTVSQEIADAKERHHDQEAMERISSIQLSSRDMWDGKKW